MRSVASVAAAHQTAASEVQELVAVHATLDDIPVEKPMRGHDGEEGEALAAQEQGRRLGPSAFEGAAVVTLQGAPVLRGTARGQSDELQAQECTVPGRSRLSRGTGPSGTLCSSAA